MSTSLAEQLQRLALPQTKQLKRDKKRASLLFDPKEAANLNKETVYQIGIDGLEELKSRDAAFEQFENTLFHITSRDFERSVESAEANQRLDKNIRKFLLLLSPYFLFNCSYKALEWLVYRYYVHEYNKEDLLMLILPYHETNIFVRVLQLLNLKAPNDKWGWLEPLQKPGIHLPKQTLYNHAASDVYFLEFVSNFVQTIIKEHENPKSLTVIFNFYCSTFTGALEYSQRINEGQVSQMLPVLVRGLTSDIPDFAASSYVICAKLLTKTQLSEKILEKFTEKITHMNVPTLKAEALLVLIVLYQSQKQFSKMPDMALKNLCSKDGIAKLLEKLNNEGIHIYPLLHPLLWSSIHSVLFKEDNEIYKTFVDDVIVAVKIEDSFINTLINSILEIYYKPKHKYPKENIKWLKDLMQRLERQHPVAFDSTVKKIMKPSDDLTHNQNQKAVRKLLGDVTNMQASYELFEKLYHPNSKIRIEGLRVLYSRIKVFKGKDKEMFQNALFDRISDDSLDVVLTTLHTFRLRFPEIVDMINLRDVLLKLLAKCQSDKDNWWKASCAALDAMCYHFRDSDIKIFLAVLPFLLPTSDNEIKAAKQVVTSQYAKNSKMLKPLKDKLEKSTSSEEFSAIIYKSLSVSENLPDVKTLVEALKGMPEKNDDVLHKYLAMLLLSSCLPNNSDVGVSCLVLSIFEMYINITKCTVVKGDAKISDYVMLARKNKFTLQGFLQCVENLILRTKIPKTKPSCIDFSLDNDVTNFYFCVLKILLKGADSSKQLKSIVYQGTLKKFLEHFCGDKSVHVIEFLLNVLIAENKLITDELRLICVKTIKAMMNKEHKNLSSLVELESVVVPYILVGLNSPNAEIRRILLEITQHLSVKSNNFAKLLMNLGTHHQEIQMDHEQMPLVMFNIFTGEAGLKKIVELLIDSTNNPDYPIYAKAGLMILLSYINDINIYEKTAKVAVEVLNKYKESSKELPVSESEIVHKNVMRFESSVAGDVNENTAIWQFIQLSLKNDTTSVKQTKPTCPAVLMLDQASREVFSNLKRNIQEALLDSIIEVVTNSQNPEVLQAASHVFKRIDLDTMLVLNQLQKMRDVRSPKEDPAKRKRRVGIIPTVDILDTNEWKKGVTVLEFIQDKKKIRNTTMLLSVLFEILKKCLDFDEQASVEYTKQLLLSTILHCCNKIEVDNQPIPENAFNMQLVVQCIRASQNPQTHHHALLLLAQTASLIPKEVLHHIIAIFTFMGSSVLRHDDAYSFQIITKIIDTIIPILIQDGSTESVATVVRVFVDAILDVPEHRRMPLFKLLLTRLNPKDNLYLFLLIIFEAHVVHGYTEKQKINKSRSLVGVDDTPKRLDIAADLCREFAPEMVLVTCIKALQYLCKLPEEKGDESENMDSFTFDIKRYSAKQFRHYKYTIILFTSNLLSSTQFVMQVAALSDEEMLQLEALFKDMIISVLNYIQQTSKVAERSLNTQQAHYWKIMLHHSYDTLDAINALLTNQMFLLVIRGLMVYSLSPVRKRALELLNNKLQHTPTFFNECDKTELYNVIVSPLINIIKAIDKPEVEPDQEQIVQRALISLKLLVKQLAPENPDKFVQILDFIADLVKTGLGKIHENVFASLITCLAELCSTLRAHAISSLSKFMPVLIKLLKSQKRLEVPNLLLITDIAVIHKILDSLPLFLSPYLEKLLYEISLIACKWNVQTDDQKLLPFITKLQSIQQKMGSIIPLRVLLPAVENSYGTLVEKRNYSAIGPLMTVLSESLTNLKGSDIQGHLTELTNFFLNALQFRSDVQSTLEEANEVEAHIVKAFVTLILKLSESTFRPLYYKIFDWAVRTDAKTERVITFYNLSSAFANCLKGLFVLFAGHFLNSAATLLDACNTIKNEELYFEDNNKNMALLENILKTLHAVFLYDSQKFVTKERFEVLMQPVVDQLENTLGGIASLENRSKSILTPCIVQFAVATADDALWKQMNYQILLKTRHNSPNIRLVALECLSETAKKLGEDFLPLLPETIPFLAELLEDEEENVEKACQRTVQELEKVLGEPLQKYF